MEITLDKQVVSQRCPHCGADFVVVRGSAYDAGQGFGLYLIALHGHSPQGRVAHLAVAVLDRTGAEPVPIAAAMDVLSLPAEIGYALVEWPASPWAGERYLGVMLTPEQVRSSPHRGTFFHVAEHVTRDVPEVRAYLAEPDVAH